MAPAPINPTRTSFSLIGKQLCSCVWQRETVSLARPALQCHDPHGLVLAPNSFPPPRHRPQPDGTGGGQVPAGCTPAGRALPRCGRARDEISPGEDPRGPLRSPAHQPVRQHPGDTIRERAVDHCHHRGREAGWPTPWGTKRILAGQTPGGLREFCPAHGHQMTRPLGTVRSRGVAVKPQSDPKTRTASCTSLSEARFRRRAAMM